MIKQLVSKIKKIPYWYLLVLPYAALYLGMGLNQLALITNGNQMPVFVPASLSDICADPVHAFVDNGDTIHSCMTPATHLKFLCDWIALGNPNPDYIMSIGDIFIFLYEDVIPYAFVVWFVLMIHKFYGGKSVVQTAVPDSGDRTPES